MSLSSGTVIGQYRIGRKLGSGGMGEVYQATHLVLGREVALKTLRPDTVGGDLHFSLIQEARPVRARPSEYLRKNDGLPHGGWVRHLRTRTW